MISYKVLYQGREGAPEDQPDTLLVDYLGVLTAGEEVELTPGQVWSYRTGMGVPLTEDNLPDNVKLTVEVGGTE